MTFRKPPASVRPPGGPAVVSAQDRFSGTGDRQGAGAADVATDREEVGRFVAPGLVVPSAVPPKLIVSAPLPGFSVMPSEPMVSVLLPPIENARRGGREEDQAVDGEVGAQGRGRARSHGGGERRPLSSWEPCRCRSCRGVRRPVGAAGNDSAPNAVAPGGARPVDRLVPGRTLRISCVSVLKERFRS